MSYCCYRKIRNNVVQYYIIKNIINVMEGLGQVFDMGIAMDVMAYGYMFLSVFLELSIF